MSKPWCHDLGGGLMTRTLRALVVLVACALVLAGCSRLPQSGPVGESEDLGTTGESVTHTFNPAGPAEDASPESIINGFIVAATGVQDDFAVARSYLTDSAAEQWDPLDRTLVYQGSPAVVSTEDTDTYTVQFEVDSAVDAQGVMSPLPSETTESLEIKLTEVDGQWRISELPDGIALDSAQFSALFVSQTLYFYDFDYHNAVPDTRWFLDRSGQATAIVEALITGPASYLEGAVANPMEQVELARPSVPISSGTASIDVKADSLAGTTALQRQRIEHQLQMTLGTRPRISDVKLTVGLEDVDTGEPDPQFRETPTTYSVGARQIAINHDTNQLVYYQGSNITEIPGVADVSSLGPHEPTMNVEGNRFVFLNEDSTQMVGATNGSAVQELASGTDLLAPSLDNRGWAWTVSSAEDEHSEDAGESENAEAAVSGSEQTLLASEFDGEQVQEISVPWLMDGEIKAVRVSPEGSRIAMILERDNTQQLFISGIVRDDSGKPLGLVEPLVVETAVSANRVQWYSMNEVLIGEVSSSERVELEMIGLAGTSVTFKPMLGMRGFSTGAGNATVYAETDDEVYIRVGTNWRAQEDNADDLSYPG
ncbi:hypothetical protein DCC26_03420 [Auritidibacter sp. NML120779]|nr:hypothetical protein DCC26_03420 [Auritidibacter sp. NML120779]